MVSITGKYADLEAKFNFAVMDLRLDSCAAPACGSYPRLARHAQRILNETLNKTDANDADGLAQLAEAGCYQVVRVKSFDAMLTRTLIGVRKQVAAMSIQLSKQIRGVMKTFDLIVPKGKGRGVTKRR